MMTRYLIRIALSFAVATGLAHAQATGSQSQPQSQSTPSAVAPPPIAGRMVLGVTVAENDALAGGYRVSKMLRTDVRNDKNEKIGKVDDLIVKPDGTITIAVIDVGAFLGRGTHRVAIPVGQFTQVKPHLVLPGATKEALKALPTFEYAKIARAARPSRGRA